ncbi:MAG: EamA family transporter [Eubacteriaceae bacterium]|nr:EamA family transporter [Eubacteriaceae bacterium]
MNNSMIFVLIFLGSVFISAISQIILKKSANGHHDSIIKEYLNAPVIIAYSFFLLSTLLTAYAYKGVPLSLGPVLEATGYVYVAVLGALVLKEKATRKKVIGNGLIIIGIIIFAVC